jgi:hypothetical protein
MENELLAATRKAKQSFLVAEIVDLNYNPDLFLEFCEKKKSNNIDEWSFEELEICVSEFKKSIKSINPSTETPKTSTNPTKPSSEPPSNKFLSDCEISNLPTIKCLRNELDSHVSLKVIVCNPELVDPGFLSSKYFVYFVNTLPPNWIVRRKIEEFLWLRETLLVLYPGTFIPSLHRSSKTRPEDKGLYKRQVMFSSFLNNILSSPLLRNSEYVLAFLKEEDLKNIVKHSKRLQKSRDFSSVSSYQGEVQLVYAEMNEKYEVLCTYLTKSEKTLNEILERLKKLIADSVILSDSIKEYAEFVGNLAETYEIVKNRQSRQVFFEVKQALICWAEFSMKSTKFIYEDIKLPLNIFKQELVSLRELVKEREILITLYRNKEKSKNFRDFFAFINFNCLSESGVTINKSIKILKEKLENGFIKKQKETVEFHMVWGNMMANLAIVN